MIIAVDFDGTIVEHKYPKIAKAFPFAFETLKALQKNGHQIILCKYRTGQQLDEAVKFCHSKGIEFYPVNKNYPEEEYDITIPRKIHADVYTDDRNIGGLLPKREIYRIICPEVNYL